MTDFTNASTTTTYGAYWLTRPSSGQAEDDIITKIL